MSEPQTTIPPASKSDPAGPQLKSSAQFLIALGVTVAFLAYLLVFPAAPRGVEIDDSRREADAAVEVVGPNLIRVKPGGTLEKKIRIAKVREEILTDPLLTVPGRVVASLRPGMTPNSDFWQFDSAEVLTTYNDWQKAKADIGFAETMLLQTTKLADARLEAQKEKVDYLKKLFDAGTDARKDWSAEKANLLQTEISGKKDIHEADTAVRIAKRNEAATSRLLQQAGLDTELLQSATSDIDIVMADVPEGKLNRVKAGQGVRALFFGLPGEKFKGKVNSIAPVLSKERRSLRVLFVIEDLKDQLRSGMFAEIGIGTDPRKTLFVPAEGILHIGRADYALAAGDDHTWRVVEVQIGEPHGSDVEILEGLKAGERVMGRGAILLKPLVVRAIALATKAEDGR